AGARPGDVLFLTKALGTGIIGTAIELDRADAASIDEAVTSMRTLNRAAAEAAGKLPAPTVHASTDTTGLGLVGPSCEIARASNATPTIRAAAVPVLRSALDRADENRSGGLSSNEADFGTTTQIGADVESNLVRVLYDPQTSGGLLIAV